MRRRKPRTAFFIFFFFFSSTVCLLSSLIVHILDWIKADYPQESIGGFGAICSFINIVGVGMYFTYYDYQKIRKAHADRKRLKKERVE